MLHVHTRRSSIVFAVGVGVIAAGCQKYSPHPLDLPAHREAWLARTPGAEPVRALAERLNTSATSNAFDPSDGVTLAEAEIVALVFNLDLRMARLRAGVARAVAEHAGVWSDPVFSLDALRITESAED